MPRCTFGDDGAAPTGCAGRNGCMYAGVESSPDSGVDASSPAKGFGYCGGCTADADCPSPLKCQRESGFCLASLIAVTKAIGDPCSKTDPPNACACYRGESGNGYCTRLCRVTTDENCPPGFACDPGLPIEFAKAPVDLAGVCTKTCTTDADCAALNATCVAAGGLTTKVCRPK